MDLEKIMAISGKPGLYKLIAQSKGGIIVESLTEKKRFPITARHQAGALKDVAIYTHQEEVPLTKVFEAIYDKENGGLAPDHKQDENVLTSWFREILPDFDEKRVYISNIRKTIQWYNLLQRTGLLKKEEKTEEQEVKKEEKKEE